MGNCKDLVAKWNAQIIGSLDHVDLGRGKEVLQSWESPMCDSQERLINQASSAGRRHAKFLSQCVYMMV